ncbi:MAG: DNA repair protein RecN [Candidatus Latescibacterota bacterium]
MLRGLHIQNFALIEDIDVEFEDGFNVITGETGAGKSILIGALSLILGDRSHSEGVRKGAKKSIVEGFFQLAGNDRAIRALSDLGVEVDDELIIRREIEAEGRGRCFANDRAITARTLKTIGDLLVDLHGQHDHQALLRVETHLEFLDRFGGLDDRLGALWDSHRQLLQFKGKLEALQDHKEAKEERRDLYAFQLDEIAKADPKPDETETLERERVLLEHREQLIQVTQSLSQLLYDGEDSVADRLGVGEHMLEEAVGADVRLSEQIEAYRVVGYQIADLATFFRNYADGLERDPYRLEEVRERLAQLRRLEKKYGGCLAAVMERKSFVERELQSAEDLGEQIEDAERGVAEATITFSQQCAQLSESRGRISEDLSRQIERALAELGMAEASFEVRLSVERDPEGLAQIDGERFKAGPEGRDACEFFICTNVGEERMPLARIASGGEISRIMLALKSILAEGDAISTCIFDEIDIGISGRIAEAVGRKLCLLSKSRQTISITHLPQIASLADVHFMVKKEVHGERTRTEVVRLDEEACVEEVARLLGGEKISELTRQHAREMRREAAAQGTGAGE